MKKYARTLIVLIVSLLFTLPVFAQSFKGGNIPAPTLLRPAEKTDITGKDVLRFKWSSAAMDIDHLEFKLFKGGIGSADLIFSQNLSAFASYLELKSEMFEDGQSYSWQVRAISDEGYKSDWAFDSFTVTKK